MDSKSKKHQSNKKAKERKQRLLEMDRKSCCCNCGDRGSEEKKSFHRAVKFSHLPEEIIIEILSYFSLRDLLRFKQVSKYLRKIVDQSQVTWANVSFQSIWPKSKNMIVFEKAAQSGNIECLAKLAFVSLYFYNFKGAKKCLKTSLENASKAVGYFSKIDELISPELPLTWMFIRPPWANAAGVRKSLKECMLLKIEEKCNAEEVSIPSLYNVGRTCLLREDDQRERAFEFFKKAADMGCIHSKWELFKAKELDSEDHIDTGVALDALRNLQDISSDKNFVATKELCKKYLMPVFGSSLAKKPAVDYYRKVMSSCKPSGIHNIVTNSPTKVTENMRCILVNWMHEVCDVKGMDSGALHMAVDCLDRYLLNRLVNRKQLQLVGVSCVVLASKVFSTSTSSLLTIRESAWLTDNTYEYNEVVRMLAEIIGVLRGKLFRMNTNHFGEIMSVLASLDQYNQHFLHYLIDSSLQFCEFGRFKPSLIAAAATFLTNIISKSGNIWPSRMTEYTGFEVKDLANCVALLHSKCLLDEGTVIDGEHKISGARDRYSAVEYMEVAKRSVPDLETVRSYIDDLEPRLRSELENGCLRFSFKEEKNMLDPVSNISASSSFLCGYEGDEEDNEVHSFCDTSLFYGKEQRRPTLEGFLPDVFSEETNKYSPQPFADDAGTSETIDCMCHHAKSELEAKGECMDKLTAVFSAACSCSSSLSSRSSSDVKTKAKLDGEKRPVYTRKKFTMNLRSSSSNTAPTSQHDSTDRERRKRSANWPVCHHSERKCTLRPKSDGKEFKKKPWR